MSFIKKIKKRFKNYIKTPWIKYTNLFILIATVIFLYFHEKKNNENEKKLTILDFIQIILIVLFFINLKFGVIYSIINLGRKKNNLK